MRLGLILSLSVLLLCNPGYSQTAAPVTQPQTVQSLARSALLEAVQPTSITLDGTFTSTEGSLHQNGNAHLAVGSDGTFLINLSRTVGPISESRTVTSDVPACTWTDQESEVHNSTFLNCMSPAWFFPGLTLLASSSDSSLPTWTPSSVSTDSLGEHLRFQFLLPSSTTTQEDAQLLSPFDLVLAPDTHLPQYALFTAHPDNAAISAGIPVRIVYANYRNISGVMIPFHIQRFVNGSPVLDRTITAASVQ